MKKILDFNTFHLLKEEAGVDLGGEPTADTPAAPAPKERKSEETTKRNAAIVLKELLWELRSNFIYWFHFGELSKILIAEADDMTCAKRELCIWATEEDASGNVKYQWRIKILEAEQEGEVEKIERVRISFDVFDDSKQYLLSSTEKNIKLSRLNDDYVVGKIKKIKNTIIKKPKTQGDVAKFKGDQEERLSDDIY
jgi:hypothetical protein